MEGEDPLDGRIVQRRCLALLALLASSRDRPASRDKLIACLWPERGASQARHSLSDSLHGIHKALGEKPVLAVGDELRLDPEVVSCDVWQFEAALEAGDLERAVGLYAGPFLDGFFIGSDALEFESWAASERERLARAYLGAVERLAESAARAGEPRQAAEWWRRLCAEDPDNSRAVLGLMTALVAAGDRAAALRQADEHAEHLKSEYGAEPDPTVTALARRLQEAPEVWVPVATASDYRRRPGTGTVRRMLVGGVILAATLAIILTLRGSLPTREAKEPESASIAVMPFKNAGGGEDDEYFSDGIMEEILARLSKIEGLKVIARSSVIRYRDTVKSPHEIGDELGVSTLLEVRVRRSSDRLRIAAELVDTRTGEALWSEIYDRDPADIFAIQSDVAEKIASALRTALSPAEQEGLRGRPTTDLEAYHLYLRGRYFWNTRSEEGLRKAIDYFRQAIDRDPTYARAYAGLADAWNQLGQWYLPSDEAFPLARDAALQALAIDSTLAEPRVALGYIAMEYEWDWPAAERWLESAVLLDPGYSSGHQYYGNFLRIMGRFDEAIAQGETAVEIDPLSIPQQAELGYTYYYARRNDEAHAQLARTLEMDTTYAHAHLRMGQVLEQQGRFSDAVREMRRAVELSDGSLSIQAALAHALALAGEEAEARRILQRLESPGEGALPSSYGAAIVYAALGEHDQSFLWLQEALAARSPSMNSLHVHPWLDPLRGDERFDELLRRMKLEGS